MNSNKVIEHEGLLNVIEDGSLDKTPAEEKKVSDKNVKEQEG